MGTDFARTRVLLVDKTAHGRSLLRGMLATLGVRKLETRTDAVMALELLRREPYDIVLCDEWLAPMSAQTFVKVLRHDVRSCDMTVPVVLMADGSDARNMERIRDAGVSDVILKPLSIGALHHKLEIHLARSGGLAAMKGYLLAELRKSA